MLLATLRSFAKQTLLNKARRDKRETKMHSWITFPGADDSPPHETLLSKSISDNRPVTTSPGCSIVRVIRFHTFGSLKFPLNSYFKYHTVVVYIY